MIIVEKLKKEEEEKEAKRKEQEDKVRNSVKPRNNTPGGGFIRSSYTHHLYRTDL